jgi:hypothetical protein
LIKEALIHVQSEALSIATKTSAWPAPSSTDVRYIGHPSEREPLRPYPVDHGIRPLVRPDLKPARGIGGIAGQETLREKRPNDAQSLLAK